MRQSARQIFIAFMLSSACLSASAQTVVDVHPRKEMTCGGDGSTIKQARIALLSRGAQRTYRTITDRMVGTVALKFTQRKTALTVDAVRVSCVLVDANGFEDKVTRDLALTTTVTIPVGDSPTTIVAIEASPRKITWSAATSPPPPPPPAPPPPATNAPPGPPGVPVLTADPGGVQATWTAGTGATEYLTWWVPDGGAATYIVTQQTTLVVPLKTKGEFCLKSRSTHGQSDYRCTQWDPAGAVVPAPTLTAQLTWDAVSVATGYRVHIGTVPGFGIGAGIDVGNVTSYTATSFIAGTTRYFKVTAYDQQGRESVPSNEVSKQF